MLSSYASSELCVLTLIVHRYSSNQDISSAASLLSRQEIVPAYQRAIPLLQKVSFVSLFSYRPLAHLSVHSLFFNRYKVRGIRNLIFYGLPDHPQFYTELLSYPFLDDGVDVSDVTCRVLYSKYDWFRLERIAGTEGAVELARGDNSL